VVPPHTPEQQCEPRRQGPSTALQAVSQRPLRQRWLQQSTSPLHAAPGSSQADSQRELNEHRAPAQHHPVFKQNAPSPTQAT
jgi:hypothetical protein